MKKFLIISMLSLLAATAGTADTIYFKDGRVLSVGKTRIENRRLKYELYGVEQYEMMYKIDRVEKDAPEPEAKKEEEDVQLLVEPEGFTTKDQALAGDLEWKYQIKSYKNEKGYMHSGRTRDGASSLLLYGRDSDIYKAVLSIKNGATRTGLASGLLSARQFLENICPGMDAEKFIIRAAEEFDRSSESVIVQGDYDGKHIEASNRWAKMELTITRAE